MKRILITGAAGFLAHIYATVLLKEGYFVMEWIILITDLKI
jgi:nucleoside-diphosphate-sugar epimerase